MAKSAVKIMLEEKEFIVIVLIGKLIYFTNREGKQNDGGQELKRLSFSLLINRLQLIYSKHITEIAIGCTRNDILFIHFLTIVSLHSKKHHHVKFYADALFVTPAYLNKIVKDVKA